MLVRSRSRSRLSRYCARAVRCCGTRRPRLIASVIPGNGFRSGEVKRLTSQTLTVTTTASPSNVPRRFTHHQRRWVGSKKTARSDMVEKSGDHIEPDAFERHSAQPEWLYTVKRCHESDRHRGFRPQKTVPVLGRALANHSAGR